MTRKQAIILLRRISNSLSKYCDVNDCICGNCAKCYEALDMAEKALEQESSEDLISRQDAIDALAISSVHAWSVKEDLIAHNWALKIISELPAKW